MKKLSLSNTFLVNAMCLAFAAFSVNEFISIPLKMPFYGKLCINTIVMLLGALLINLCRRINAIEEKLRGTESIDHKEVQRQTEAPK